MVLHLREKKRNLCHNRDFPLLSTDSFYKRLKHCTEAKPSSVPQNWWMCSRREATTTGKKPGIRWQISIFPHAALKYESIKRRIIICTLEIQPQKVRREIPYEILNDAPEENPFTCVNSKIDKNETLERFTCIAIFQASGRKKKFG